MEAIFCASAVWSKEVQMKANKSTVSYPARIQKL